MKYLLLDFDRTLFNTELFYNSIELQYIAGMQRFPNGFDFRKFLYDDSVIFLTKARSLGWKLILLTYGQREVQEYKVHASGIDEYFDQLFYVENGTKVDAILPIFQNVLANNTRIVFIDDTTRHLTDFKSTLPHSKVFRMARIGAKGSDSIDTRFTIITNFNDVLELL